MGLGLGARLDEEFVLPAVAEVIFVADTLAYPALRRARAPGVIIDTSVLIAILRAEGDASDMALAIERAQVRKISAANYLDGDRGRHRRQPYRVRIAREAYRDFGKGSGDKG